MQPTEAKLSRAAMRKDPVRWGLETQAVSGRTDKPRTQSKAGLWAVAMGVFVEQVEMVSRNQWTKIDPHSGCLKCSHAAESCWPETRPFSNFIAPCTFQGTTHTACLRGSLRMCVSSLHYQNINFLKASAGLTHLPTRFVAHTQCLAQCLACNQYNKYLFDGLIKTLHSLVSNMTK